VNYLEYAKSNLLNDRSSNQTSLLGICCNICSLQQALKWRSYSCYDQSETCMTYGNSKLRCVSMIFHIVIYQTIIMPYQARCYGISALRQTMYQGW